MAQSIAPVITIQTLIPDHFFHTSGSIVVEMALQSDPSSIVTRLQQQDVDVLYDQLQNLINSGQLSISGLNSEALTIMPQNIDGSNAPPTSNF